MNRNYKEITDIIKEKFNVNTVYSYSQIKLFNEDPYEYLLKYIDKVEPDKDIKSPYGLIGGLVHDLLEKFYKNEISRSDCKKLFLEGFSSIMNDPGSGVFSEDIGQNHNISTNIIRDIGDYFTRVNKLNGKVLCEEPMYCYLSGNNINCAFVGYIDFLNFNKGKINIIDYKTSTMYKESDIPKYSDQLILYAEMVKQRYGVNYEDINVGWNFLKYAKVTNRLDLSEEIVERKNLLNYDPEYYFIDDCIINVEFNELVENDFINKITNIVSIIENKTNEYINSGDDNLFFWEVTQPSLFRLNNFCNYSEKLHRPLREYLEKNKQ